MFTRKKLKGRKRGTVIADLCGGGVGSVKLESLLYTYAEKMMGDVYAHGMWEMETITHEESGRTALIMYLEDDGEVVAEWEDNYSSVTTTIKTASFAAYCMAYNHFANGIMGELPSSVSAGMWDEWDVITGFYGSGDADGFDSSAISTLLD